MIGNISTNGLTPILLAKKMKIDYDARRPDHHAAGGRAGLLSRHHDEFPARPTFADFLAYAKEHPGKVRYGSAGIGSYQQINTEILAKRAGLDLVHIPFKGGGAEIIRDLANGDIQVSWFNITNPVGMMKAGRVRALAIAAERRLPQHPDVPTLAEVGFPGMRASQWVAAFAPAGGPARHRRDAASGVRQGDDRARHAGGLRARRNGRSARNPRSTTPKAGCGTKWRTGSATSRTSASSWRSELENRNPAGRRHRPRSRSGMRQGDEGGRRARAARDRLAAAADRQARARGARQHASGGDRAEPARARRLGDGTDRARRLSARRCHLGDAAGAQEVRPVRGGAAGAVPCHHSVDPQRRRHRLPARADRGDALFRDGGRGRCRSSGPTTTSPSPCA